MNLSRPHCGSIAKALFLLGLGAGLAMGAGAQDSAPTPNPGSTTATASVPVKPKKVWTNDDVAATEAPATAKAKSSPNTKASDSNDKLAHELRAKIEKLEAQLKDADRQLTDLKNFEAGEVSGKTGRDLHKGYNMTPIPEQIEKMEQKKAQIRQQIDAAYDEARKRGILPGQLR